MLGLLIAALALPGGDDRGAVIDTADAGSTSGPVHTWLRRSTAPPSPAELDRLAALARRAPLRGALPDAAPLLGAFPPARPTAGRNAAIDWRLSHGTPGDTVLLRLRDAGGPLDSARVVLDAAGAGAGSFRVRPTRQGWSEWQLEAAGHVASAGAWAAPAEPLGLLIVAAPGSVEAREAARALERSGENVTLATDLGHGLRLGDAPAGLPPTEVLASFDVVLLQSPAPPSPGERLQLLRYVAGGGGVLAAGAAAAAFGVEVGPPRTVPADDLSWSAPAGIEPLPRVSVPVDVAALSPPSSFRIVASAGESAFLALAAHGRGRIAALGLVETSRWALAAGRTDGHAAFWTSLAGWLAGEGRGPLAVWVDPPAAPPGIAVHVRVARLDSLADRPLRIHVGRPDGGQDTLPVAWSGDEGTARFIARDPGVVLVRLPSDTSPAAAHFADADAGAPPDAWARLAEIVRSSGGRLVPADSLDEIVAGSSTRSPLRTFLLVLCGLVACGDWAARRLRGRA